MRHCQKLGDGRSPPVTTPQHLLSMQSEIEAIALENPGILPNMWLPLVAEEGVWRDYYTGEGAETIRGEQYNQYDCFKALTEEIGLNPRPWTECECEQSQMSCMCEYTRYPVVTLRGLCPQLYKKRVVDSKFIPFQNRSSPVEFHWQGLRHSTLRLNAIDKKWRLSSSMSQVSAILIDGPRLSFGLGFHEWEVSGDSWCKEGKSYKTLLKFTGCDQSREFTCDDGQCIKMEKRCNQMPNCRDRSDEKDCHMLLLEEGYNKNVPPIVEVDDKIMPVHVNISITLMRVVEIEQSNHFIHLQFQISLDWNEPRATYQYLRKDTNQNALLKSDMERIWLPLVVYDNTDQKEMTRLGMDWEWITTVAVTREEENPRKSGLDEIHETEYFQGAKNRLTMNQTYTWEFQCKYKLQRYPFDTQVFENHCIL